MARLLVRQEIGAAPPCQSRGRGARAIVVAVQDTGPGIPAAARELVIERFVRLDRSRGTPGSGLGLSLVAAVAKLHGGALELSDNAPGLRVRLRLPASGAASGVGPSAAPARPRAGA